MCHFFSVLVGVIFLVLTSFCPVCLADFLDNRQRLEELIFALGSDCYDVRCSARERLLLEIKKIEKREYADCISFFDEQRKGSRDSEIVDKINLFIGYLQYKFEGVFKEISEDLFGDEAKEALLAGDEDMALGLALIDSASWGDAEMVAKLLDVGADIHARNQFGWTPLHAAAAEGETECVHLLLRSGANIEAKDGDGWTPLMVATVAGLAPNAKALLEAGADPNRREESLKWSALMLAAREGHPSIVKLLIEHGADIRAREESGKTAMDIAHERGHEEIVQILRSAQKD